MEQVLSDPSINGMRRWQSAATRCIALVIVVLDATQRNPILPLAGLVVILCLNGGAAPGALGLSWSPIQGWWHWVRLAFWFGLAIAVVLLLFGGFCLLTGHQIPVYRADPGDISYKLFHMCLSAPVAEEVVYRALLAVALVSTLGRTGTIVASGLVFALIHVLGGNASPENQVAGFLLAWAFLRSGTILVPIAMHSAGNLVALTSQIAAWYWFPVGT